MANKVSFIIQLKDQFGRVAGKVDRQFSNIKRSADKASQSMVKFAKKAKQSLGEFGKKAAQAGAVMTAALTVPITMMGKRMIDAASDATETANKFNAVFDDVRGKANQVADDFAKNFGTAGSTARKLIGDTGDLLVGFGFTGDAALELSNKVNSLAADLTSFQNVEGGVDAASAALTKALLGETESAKSLGIVIRQNTKEFRTQVKLTALTKGISEQQAKAIVILNQAQQQSKKAIGDVNRTWEDYASVVRRNDEATKELSERFGKLMIPLATKLTNAMTKAVKWVDRLSPGMKKLALVLAGIVAIGGPLLVIFGGIAAAISVISLPVLAVSAAVVGLIAVIALLALNWDTITKTMTDLWVKFSDIVGGTIEQIGINFGILWDGVKTGLLNFVNFAIKQLNFLLTPLNFVADKLGFGGVNIAPIVAPSAPVNGANGTLNGQITVTAAPGTKVKDTSLKTTGNGLNLGMNMVAN